MAVTITDFGIEYNGQRKYMGPFIAGGETGFKLWCIVETSAGLRTSDGYDWKNRGGGYFKTADAGGEYTSAYTAAVIESWLEGVT
ncbi:MAG: hypothetical protein K6G90_03120 [Clostridia bacterium]|nr:hypothetical protein [Clostridia bacterium]